MAIAFDSASDAYSASTTTSLNHTASGTDRVAIIFVFGFENANEPSVTVGGSSTGVVEIGRIALTGAYQKIIAYYYLNPPTISTTYATYQSGGYQDLQVLTYTGCSTSVPDSLASKTGDTSPLDLTTTVVASDCWLVSAGRNYSTGVIVGSTGTTVRTTGTAMESGDSNGTVGTGSQTMNWTNGGSGNTGGIIFSLAPASAAPTTNSNFFAFM